MVVMEMSFPISMKIGLVLSVFQSSGKLPTQLILEMTTRDAFVIYLVQEKTIVSKKRKRIAVLTVETILSQNVVRAVKILIPVPLTLKHLDAYPTQNQMKNHPNQKIVVVLIQILIMK